MTNNKLKLNIEISEPKWDSCSKNLYDFSHQIAETVFNFVKLSDDIDFFKSGKPININLDLGNDEEIRALNKEFRGKDKATNVLSFANIDDENFMCDLEIFDEIELGDIIISFETLEKEAKEKNISFINHYTHLLVHGILHLLGFDHIDDDEADYMEECEIKILKIFNINNPYTE